jgi:hypothetical protein
MALMFPLAAEAIRSVKRDATILAETYAHPEPSLDPNVQPPFGGGFPPWGAECMEKFPKDITVQWAGDAFMPGKSAWTEAGVPPAGPWRHIMRAHFATLWMDELDNLAVDRIAALARESAAHGIDGVSIFGERSPFNANTELNYLAFADCGSAENAACDVERFLERVAAPRLGGPELAREYVRIAGLLGQPEAIAAELPFVRRTAGRLDGAAARRWAWLANYLASHCYAAKGD